MDLLKIVAWWSSQSLGAWPEGTAEYDAFTAANGSLGKTLKKGRWGSVQLQGYDDTQGADAKHHYFLYATFRLP